MSHTNPFRPTDVADAATQIATRAFAPRVAEQIAPSGVVPGAYTSANVTVGADGRLTAAASGSGGGGGHTVNGRLTLVSGTPIPTTDQTGKTTVYFTPYKGDQITLWDGSAWTLYTFTEASLALGTVTAFAAYDVFGYQSSGVLTLEKLEWLNAAVTMTIASPCVVTWTTHGMSNGDPVVFTTTGALPTGLSANTRYFVQSVTANTFRVSATPGGADINTSGTQSGTHTGHQSRQRGTAVTLQDGRYCKSGDKTRLYLGTFYTTSATTTEDSYGGATTNVGGKRYLWNYYNRVRRSAAVIDTTSTWAYTTNTWRQARAQVGNQVEYVCGIDEDYVDGTLCASVSVAGTSGSSARVSIGLDSITVPGRFILEAVNAGGSVVNACMVPKHEKSAGTGYHFLSWMEAGGGGTSNFEGTNDSIQTGLTANIWG